MSVRILTSVRVLNSPKNSFSLLAEYVLKMLILDHITRLQNSKGVNSLLYCSAKSVRSNMINIVVKPADNGPVTTIRRLGSCP